MSQGIENPDLATHGQQVLVLQGGGALGAYQVGVYQALDQFGIDLEWVVGTSIGAINAAIIAGSPRAERIHRMRAFWKRVEHGYVFDDILPSLLSSPLRNWLALSTGIAGVRDSTSILEVFVAGRCLPAVGNADLSNPFGPPCSHRL